MTMFELDDYIKASDWPKGKWSLDNTISNWYILCDEKGNEIVSTRNITIRDMLLHINKIAEENDTLHVQENIQLSKNFFLSEFTKSQIAERHGIDNITFGPIVERLQLLCINVLQPLRDHFDRPITITSGYRNFEVNGLLGSKETSQHITGEAADFEIAGADNLEVYNYIQDYMKFDQLILEYYTYGQPASGWIHVSYASDAHNRNESFVMEKGE